jgi:anti-sigma factor ChrR (cupin superfamily)
MTATANREDVATERTRGAAETLARDARRNALLEDTLVRTTEQEWLPFCPGITFKLLRASTETGAWTVLFHADAGSGFDRHKHLGYAEYYLISGRMEIRGGDANGGYTVIPGDYGFEANGMMHDWTNFPEESVFYFTNYGPLGFLDDNDQVVHVFDMMDALALAGQPIEAASS